MITIAGIQHDGNLIKRGPDGVEEVLPVTPG